MLQGAQIKNFQSHKDTVLSFVSGVNCIVGQSDCGKSAIMRAILWAITNKPNGEAFRSTFAGDKAITESTILFDGNKVSRRKGDSCNDYLLGEEVYKAFGVNTPEEITDAIGMGDINIAKQLDEPFLLSASSGEVARYLNQIAGLDKIDTTLANIASVIAEAKRNIKHEQLESYDLEQKLLQFKDLDAREALITKIELLENTQQSLQKDVDVLSATCQDLSDKELVASELRTWLTIERHYDRLEKQFAAFYALDKERTTLDEGIRELLALNERSGKLLAIEDLSTSYEVLDSQLNVYNAGVDFENSLKQVLGSIKDLEARQDTTFTDPKLTVRVTELDASIQKLNKLSQSYCALHVLLQDLDKLQIRDDKLTNTILDTQEEYDALFPDQCPLCGATK